jgi:hypothetical protein
MPANVHTREQIDPPLHAFREPILLFFTTHVSMAGCQGSHDAPAPMPTHSWSAGATSSATPFARERDEEPVCPEERYFSGNDVY